MKQTAVEFLIQQILKHDKSFIVFYNAEIQQALEMEKHQIIEAYNQGYRDGDGDLSGEDISLFYNADLYYNENFSAAFGLILGLLIALGLILFFDR